MTATSSIRPSEFATFGGIARFERVSKSAPRLSIAARQRGLGVRSLVDCLIASIALRQDDVVLAHCDGDFDRLAKVSPLRTERWDDSA